MQLGVTYLGTCRSCIKNFSALPKRSLSPSKFFSISNSSNSGNIFNRPRNFSAPISSCWPSSIISTTEVSFVLRNCLRKILTFKLRLPSSNVIWEWNINKINIYIRDDSFPTHFIVFFWSSIDRINAGFSSKLWRTLCYLLTEKSLHLIPIHFRHWTVLMIISHNWPYICLAYHLVRRNLIPVDCFHLCSWRWCILLWQWFQWIWGSFIWSFWSGNFMGCVEAIWRGWTCWRVRNWAVWHGRGWRDRGCTQKRIMNKESNRCEWI